MVSMDAKGRRALSVIRECVAAKRYWVSLHFAQRMDGRGIFWPDVATILDDPSAVRSDGRDSFDRPKWIVAGKTVDGDAVGIVCVLDHDDRGNVTVFITIY